MYICINAGCLVETLMSIQQPKCCDNKHVKSVSRNEPYFVYTIFVVYKEKIPHTGDTESLDRCG